MKQKLRTSRNKISMQIPVTGARCTIVWAIHVRDGNAPYWHTHHFLMGHSKLGAADGTAVRINLPATSKSNDIPDYYSRDHFGSRHSLAKI
jgi:hypothetical protein